MYELFIYIGEMNRLMGNYLHIIHRESIPYIGMDVKGGYKVSAIYDDFGIIDVVIDKY